MMIAGGMVFGPLLGTLYNIVGTFLGGPRPTSWAAAWWDFVHHLAGAEAEARGTPDLAARVLGLVGIRFLPIPYPLVNYTAALAGVRPALFLTTTAIVLIPAVPPSPTSPRSSPARRAATARPPRPVRRRLRKPAPAHLHPADLDGAEAAGAGYPGSARGGDLMDFFGVPDRSPSCATMASHQEVAMTRSFTLEYWIDDDWYIGRLKEVPSVFSQGETLRELEENIRDAYELLRENEREPVHVQTRVKEIEVEV